MATVKVDLPRGVWTRIGDAPGLLETNRSEVIKVHMGAAAPAVGSEAFHTLEDNKSLEISYTYALWGMPKEDDEDSAVVFTVGA